ncbi:MAG TPA: hypothetical protein VGD89_08185 [Flavipsychrobacter sp.]
MGNIFNDDFRDFITCLNKHNVAYILVGGMAVLIHGYIRTTGDMDIWVKKTEANYTSLTKAFSEFHLPVFDMTLEKFMGDEFDVWGFGREPVKIEIMTAVKGLDFDNAFSIAEYYLEDGLSIRYLHLNSLIQAKQAAGRYKDLDDIEQLTK